MTLKVLRRIGRLVSPGVAVRSQVDVLLEGDRIAAIVPQGEAPMDAEGYDCGGGLLTPGLIDAHTHCLYPRPRLEEVARRAAGATYSEVASAGGGIAATVRQARTTPFAELEAAARRRLLSWLWAGTTSLEAKTGYWLTREGELEAVRVLNRLSSASDLPRMAVTFLGAHEVPPEYAAARAAYVDAVAAWCPEARAAGATFCDVFCDQGAFTVAESERILRAGAAAGMRLRVHADELALSGGALLAARLRAVSADHLLAVGPREVAALALAQTVATICPITALNLGRLPPVRDLLSGGVVVALGSDHNPGTSGTTSMSLVIYLAVVELGLSIEEALAAATKGGARSLGVEDRGEVAPGLLADLVLWDADHEGAFAWEPGLRPLRVWRGGIGVG